MREESEPSQDWKYVEVVFNSLDQHEAAVYIGFWGEGKGTFWVDDLKLEELALVNVLRRPGCPLSVKSANGTTTFTKAVISSRLPTPNWGEFPARVNSDSITPEPRSASRAVENQEW